MGLGTFELGSGRAFTFRQNLARQKLYRYKGHNDEI